MRSKFCMAGAAPAHICAETRLTRYTLCAAQAAKRSRLACDNARPLQLTGEGGCAIGCKWDPWVVFAPLASLCGRACRGEHRPEGRVRACVRRHMMPESRRLPCKIMSRIASKTNLTLFVSVAHVWCA